MDEAFASNDLNPSVFKRSAHDKSTVETKQTCHSRPLLCTIFAYHFNAGCHLLQNQEMPNQEQLSIGFTGLLPGDYEIRSH
jgi:hypothetical protein